MFERKSHLKNNIEANLVHVKCVEKECFVYNFEQDNNLKYRRIGRKEGKWEKEREKKCKKVFERQKSATIHLPSKTT